MKIMKTPLLLKKAVTTCKSKTGVLGARIHVLALLRRKIALVGAISHRIQELMVVADCEKPRVDGHKVLFEKRTTVKYGDEIVDISDQLALLDQEDNDVCSSNHCDTDEYADDSDELLVMGEIRGNREVVLEFNMEDDIDRAAEMFIRKFREQMNKSF